MKQEYSGEEKLLLLQKAIALKKKGPGFKMVGICANLDDWEPFCSYNPLLLRDIFEAWPHYTGYKAFPVSTNKRIKPDDQYANCKDCWTRKTPYGRRRWELLDFIISELQKEN